MLAILLYYLESCRRHWSLHYRTWFPWPHWSKTGWIRTVYIWKILLQHQCMAVWKGFQIIIGLWVKKKNRFISSLSITFIKYSGFSCLNCLWCWNNEGACDEIQSLLCLWAMQLKTGHHIKPKSFSDAQRTCQKCQSKQHESKNHQPKFIYKSFII